MPSLKLHGFTVDCHACSSGLYPIAFASGVPSPQITSTDKRRGVGLGRAQTSPNTLVCSMLQHRQRLTIFEGIISTIHHSNSENISAINTVKMPGPYFCCVTESLALIPCLMTEDVLIKPRSCGATCRSFPAKLPLRGGSPVPSHWKAARQDHGAYHFHIILLFLSQSGDLGDLTRYFKCLDLAVLRLLPLPYLYVPRTTLRNNTQQ